MSAVLSTRPDSTIKPMKEYSSEIYSSKRTTMEMGGGGRDGVGVRPIRNHNSRQNLSGNAVYKVPNININTAIRSSKRSNHY